MNEQPKDDRSFVRRNFLILGLGGVLMLMAFGYSCAESQRYTLKSDTPAPTAAAPAVEPPAATPKVDQQAVVSGMKDEFGSDVTQVKVEDDGSGTVAVDVYTVYFPDRDVAAKASAMANVAASLPAIIDAYRDVTVTAKVWPKSRDFFMTRTTGTWQGGSLTAPFDTFVNDVLK